MTTQRSFWQAVLGRLEALVGSFLTDRIERHLLEEEIDDAVVVEHKARQLEADGMAELAARLRTKCAHIESQPNCGRGQALLADLDQESPTDSRLLSHQPANATPDKPKRTRRRRSATADEPSAD